MLAQSDNYEIDKTIGPRSMSKERTKANTTGDRIRPLTEVITTPMVFDSDNNAMRYAKVKWHKSPAISAEESTQKLISAAG